jgi:hypothetical protein
MATRLVLPVSARRRRTTFTIAATLAAYALLTAACRSEAPQQAESAATPAAASSDAHAGHTMGKVFFVEPKDGATVSSKSTTKFVFGSENYQIAAVPPGELKEARPNMGHFHLGVDKTCLPAGEMIVKGQPDWIHFGDGKNEIEMQLAPGKHTMSVQVGDDLHRAVEGLCQTITVNVE